MADRETAGLNQDTGLWLDVDQFHRLLAACEMHGHPATEVCPDCVPLLEEAAGLYRDDFLAGSTLHAIGNIDRTVYHGAYPDGTAIRFESFQLWGLNR